jgi:hypothetical protein
MVVPAVAAALAVAWMVPAASGAAAVGSAPTSNAHGIDHMFLIIEENNGFADVIGNAAAPNLTAFARQFGVASEYYGVNGTSEPNYVGLLGGSTFDVTSDNPYWTQQAAAPSLISQLDGSGISWKAYLQGLPHPGYEGICYPLRCNGSPDSDPLYVSKHDGIQNFTTSLNQLDWSRQVPIGQLASDLSTGNVPRFSYLVPDECHDMHGDPPYCLDSGNIGDPQNQHLVSVGDHYLGDLVSEITHASFWSQGNNAIAITFDSGDNTAGCCDARPGGGQVATVVITSHGPRGLNYPTPSNHYSMLSTIEHLFGLGCLQFTCDTAHVQPMLAMFRSTGSAAVATPVLPERNYPTPTPVPPEPVSTTHSQASGGGWTTQRAQFLGTSDNSLGGVGGSSRSDVWAVGSFLPDAAASNQDATLSLAEHYDGTNWKAFETPDAGPNFNTLFAVAGSAGQAWAVGTRLDSSYGDRALIEHWDGRSWSISTNPQPGAVRDLLFSVAALSPSDVWAVGDQEGADNRFETLVEHWDGSKWQVVPSPDPGSTGNHLYGVAAASPDDIWAVGQQLGSGGPDQALIEHWDGAKWSTVLSPSETSGTTMLDAVAVGGDRAWAVGEHDSAAGGGRPLVEQYSHGAWSIVTIPSSAGSAWTDLWGVAVGPGGVCAVGTDLDPVTGNNDALILKGAGGVWSAVPGPQPGSGNNIVAGVANVGGQLWAAGSFDNGGNLRPLLEHK